MAGYYAVKYGFDSNSNKAVENMVFMDNEYVRAITHKVKGSSTKKFNKEEDALDFLGISTGTKNNSIFSEMMMSNAMPGHNSGFYAIKNGFNPKTNQSFKNKIVTSSKEATLYTKGVSSSGLKKFSLIKDAEDYLNGVKKVKKNPLAKAVKAVKSTMKTTTKTTIEATTKATTKKESPLKTVSEVDANLTDLEAKMKRLLLKEKSLVAREHEIQLKEQEILMYEKEMLIKDPLEHKKDNKYKKRALHCYTDGSYNFNSKEGSCSVVYVKNNRILHIEGCKVTNKAASLDIKNVAGELLGAMKALTYAKINKHKEVVIFHDYNGVCYNAIGHWKNSNQYNKKYYDWMQAFFKENPDICVNFCKVDAHSGDTFNEIADGVAKLYTNIEPLSSFFELCDKNNINIQKKDIEDIF